ncbi:MAG: DNA translocase FtsK [Candidatus Absconditabacterales bacterium]|nr:DNA translocase FtsK [Candidatus Absconditabacterales bacterium]
MYILSSSDWRYNNWGLAFCFSHDIMPRRKKRRVSVSGFFDTLTITKQGIGGTMIAVSFLYFFLLFMTSDAPMMQFFHSMAHTAFGKLGTIPFFALLGLLGIVFLVRQDLSSVLTKASFLLFVFLSAIFNFAIIDANVLTQGSQTAFVANGGYLSWPLLWLLEQMFGTENAWAIKTFLIILFVLTVVYIGWKMQIPLPSLPRIELETGVIKQSPKAPSFKADESITLSPTKILNVASRLTQAAEGQREKKMNGRPAMLGSAGGTGLLAKIRGEVIKKVVDQKLYDHRQKSIPFPSDKPSFPLDIMDQRKGEKPHPDESMLLDHAQAITTKLEEFGVSVSVDGFDIGPSIVQMRIRPDPGVKVATIESLKNDIALSLKSGAMRIIAPIPDTDCVGIQIPNPKGHIVHLSDVLGSAEFRHAMQKSQTNLALGVGIDGSMIIKPLEKMPHLLVAGATGQGKSVGINDFIMSLIFQNSPAELKFLMIDPKQVEMEFYSGIPYLLAPIVTVPDKALKLLQWSVDEMESRYNKLKHDKVKNFDEYNEKHPDNKLYRIVIVIDELADLMMTGSKKEVEGCITRIAQKARAVGMHLIIATQRPSVNVLTGLIKANIPTRIAFGVVSQIDSRTILGFKGAEDLVGKGDMLYSDPNTKDPLRIQAPFISTPETERIIGYLMHKYMDGLTPDDIYHPEIIRILEGQTKAISSGSSGIGGGGSGDDEALIEQAIDIIRETGKASTTMLQRKLNIGFARAGRLMDELEERGVVGPQDGAKPRDIYL